MKALNILKNLKSEMQDNEGIINWDCSYEYFKKVDKAIKELKAHITACQAIRNRLDAKATALAKLQDENETLKQIIKNLGYTND